MRSRRGRRIPALSAVTVILLAVAVVVGVVAAQVHWSRQVDADTRGSDPLATATSSAPPQAAVVFLGDSVTENAAGLNAASHSDPWPTLLTSDPDSPWLQAENLAVAGETLGEQAKRWEQDGKSIPAVDTVVLLAGTNDAVKDIPNSQTQADLTKLIETIKHHGQEVVVISPPPNTTVYREKIADVVALERATAQREGVEFVDIFHGLGTSDGRWPSDKWTVDGFHPTAFGQQQIAAYVLAAVS